jgi:hypothetical protein
VKVATVAAGSSPTGGHHFFVSAVTNCASNVDPMT